MTWTDLALIVLVVAMVVAVVLLGVLVRRRAPDPALALVRDEHARQGLELAQLRLRHADLQADAARLQERCQAIAALEQARDATSAQLQAALQDVAALGARGEAQARDLHDARERIAQLQEALGEQREQLEAARAAQAQAMVRLEHSQASQEQMRAFLQEARTRLSESFAELAGKAFDERSQRAALQSKGDIETLLKPFAERLESFRSRIDVLYQDEAKERRELAGAVNALKTLNEHMASSADALTRALKGSAKVRGDWGELMLENVLRGSGLEEGTHYLRQSSTTDDEGQRLQPDIVVKLPDDRRVVIDSKVNLIAWQEAMNAESPEVQMEAMRRHAVALRQHVRDLAERNYPKALGDCALDITLAFVPIEGALSAALGTDPELQQFAFQRKVAFASPNTLMGMLRVVERLWTRDKLQRQALEISEAGGRVLDALQGFLAEFDQVGRKLADAQQAFSASRNRLNESTHAVIPRARRLVELGARGKRALPEELKADAPPLPWLAPDNDAG